MRQIDEIANRYVAEWAELDPVGATYHGVSGQDARLTDLSRDGYAARDAHARQTLAALAAATPADERERVAADAMTERLTVAALRQDAGQLAAEMNVISSGLHHTLSVFDLMPTDGEEAVASPRNSAAIKNEPVMHTSSSGAAERWASSHAAAGVGHPDRCAASAARPSRRSSSRQRSTS